MILLDATINSGKSFWSLLCELYELSPVGTVFMCVSIVFIFVFLLLACIGMCKICKDPKLRGTIYTPWGTF